MGAYILLVHGRIYINDLLLPSVFQVHDLASRFDAGPTTDCSFRATAQRGSPPGTPEHYTAHPRFSALFSVCLSSPDAIIAVCIIVGEAAFSVGNQNFDRVSKSFSITLVAHSF